MYRSPQEFLGSFLKKKVTVSEKKVSALIPKLDLGFGSRNQNLLSVIHKSGHICGVKSCSSKVCGKFFLATS